MSNSDGLYSPPSGGIVEKEFLFITLLAFLLIPKLVSADGVISIIPFSLTTLPVILFIILIEVFVFWFLINKWIKVQTGFQKLILVVFLANFVTSLVGIFIPFDEYDTVKSLRWIGVAFISTVFIEWGIYIPFFRKPNIKIFDLLKISFIVNLATYIPLIIFLGFTEFKDPFNDF